MKIVSEIGLVHDGSLGNALAYVDACANAGVDAIKFQHHYGDPVDKFRPAIVFPQDASRQDFWRRTDFTIDQWKTIRNRCHECCVQFGLSIFSALAVRTFTDCGFCPDFWKLGSGVVSNSEIHKALRKSLCRKVVISSGMSSTSEIKAAFNALAYGESESAGMEIVLLQCTSEYPCPPEHIGMSFMEILKDIGMNATDVGISDHSGTIWPSIVAASAGADMVEVHVCWDRRCFGADIRSSVTIDELEQLVAGVRFVERMKPVDKDKMASELSDMRKVFCVQ